MKQIKFLDLYKQSFFVKKKIIQKINKCIKNSSFIGGDELERFNKNFKKYLKVKYCLGVANGTDALEIAIKSLDLKKDSEIIVPSNSWISSAEAVLSNGHKVKFVDINDTSNICIKDLKKKISKKTSAIIVVHLYGNPAEIDKIKKIAKKFNLKIIEDCAQSHGASLNGKKVSTFGDISTFSFFPSKNLGCYGDGGAIVTNTKKYYIKSKKIANHGGLKKNKNEILGRNSRLDNLQASILNVKLNELDKWIEIRNKQASLYNFELKNIGDIKFIDTINGAKSSNYVFVIKTKNRQKLQGYLKKNKIETHIHYPHALPELKIFRKEFLYKCRKMKSIKISKQILSLPIGEHLVLKDIKYICAFIKNFYNE
jgi:dTDP-4-amino-4,6-dideoxygalactose transaminase